eukprot:TRINITY_DN6269_c0_g1_i4.p1 TRINITY_DN6269_c0_g1~~TRINITY_DN6269_c0_g1_i4.p1  ORF type:complete len:226 (+),score=40.40 TRINITY_DN6269_c0_g1_i4:68-745(+)
MVQQGLGLRTALNMVAARYPDCALIVHRVKRFKQDAQERLWTYHSQFDDVKDVVLTFDLGKTGELPTDSPAKIGNIAFVIMARPEGVYRVLAQGNEPWMGDFYLRVDKFVPRHSLERAAEQASGHFACAPDSSSHLDDATLLPWKETRRTSFDSSFLRSGESKTFVGRSYEHSGSPAASGISLPDRPQSGDQGSSRLSALIARYALPEPAVLPGLQNMRKCNNDS